MIRFIRALTALALAVVGAGAATPSAALAEPPSIGIVIMHGKGGAPTKFVAGLASAVARARQAVAEGKGEDKLRLLDYEGSRGTYPIVAAAAVYLDWFDPQGAMNLARTALALKPPTPILWLVAKNDYPGLRRANIPLYGRIPANPLNAFYEPNSSHLEAPSAALDEIVRWAGEVASSPKR